LSLFHTLNTATTLAEWLHQPDSVVQFFAARARILGEAINDVLWDNSVGAFRDSTSRPQLHPQDANALAIVFEVTNPERNQEIKRYLLRNWTPIGPNPPELPGNVSPFITSFELRALFMAGDTRRALDLMKRVWGWYLLNPNGTQSTMIEGYRTDGTFGYRATRGYGNDPSYVSHAHGWSSGATSALTNFIGGIAVLEKAAARWGYHPQFYNLKFAETGFTTSFGKYRTRWSIEPGGYDLFLDMPWDTEGIILLPPFEDQGMNVTINGEHSDATEYDIGITLDVPGGVYDITVRKDPTKQKAKMPAPSPSPTSTRPPTTSTSRPRPIIPGLGLGSLGKLGQNRPKLPIFGGTRGGGKQSPNLQNLRRR